MAFRKYSHVSHCPPAMKATNREITRRGAHAEPPDAARAIDNRACGPCGVATMKARGLRTRRASHRLPPRSGKDDHTRQHGEQRAGSERLHEDLPVADVREPQPIRVKLRQRRHPGGQEHDREEERKSFQFHVRASYSRRARRQRSRGQSAGCRKLSGSGLGTDWKRGPAPSS